MKKGPHRKIMVPWWVLDQKKLPKKSEDKKLKPCENIAYRVWIHHRKK